MATKTYLRLDHQKKKPDRGREKVESWLCKGNKSWKGIKEKEENRSKNRGVGAENQPLESLASWGYCFIVLGLFHCNFNLLGQCNECFQ